MKKGFSTLLIFCSVVWLSLFPMIALSQEGTWKRVDSGLFIGLFDHPKKGTEDDKITIVKIDPNFYSFKLLCASEQGKDRMTVKSWCKKYHLISGINAGMYQKDGMTNVGYMKNFNHLNNPRVNTSYHAFWGFNPTDSAVPEIQIIDRKCQDFDQVRFKYQTLIQNIRMISCRQENVWSKQEKKWSMAVFGMDKGGNALFIFTRTPYSSHDFINMLLGLPISIYNAMYLEGGPEASLYFSAHGFELERWGAFETGLNETDSHISAWPVPNVVGIVKKPK